MVLRHGGVVLLNFVVRSTAGDEQQEEQEEEKCLRSHGDKPACLRSHGINYKDETIKQIEAITFTLGRNQSRGSARNGSNQIDKKGRGRRRFGCLLLAILVGLAMRAGLDWIWSPAAGSGGCRGAREVQTRGHAGTSPRLRRRAATPGRRSSCADTRPRRHDDSRG